MDLGLNGKRAAVAASTAGLGFECAAALAAEGVQVVVCGHDQEHVDAAVRRIGGDARGIRVDLTSLEECERFVVQARDQLGGLDILIANGPGPRPGTFASFSAHDYEKALELNLLSVVRMCYAAVPQMQAQRWGRVVAITSSAVREPIANLILSNTARAGATGFLKTLAREVARDGVTVNSVQPGLHLTNRLTALHQDGLQNELAQIPSRSLGQPADFGAMVAFLCSEQARYVTGVALPIDGGRHHGLQ